MAIEDFIIKLPADMSEEDIIRLSEQYAKESDRILPSGKIDGDYDSQIDYMVKTSRLYTPPPKEYEEPIEDLYDWYTGKIREP